MRKLKKIFVWLMLCVLCAMSLAGCKKQKTEKNTDAVVVGIQQDIDSLDPHTAVAAGTREVLYNVYEGLMRVTPDGDIVPNIATNYSISSDGRIYTFNIRADVKFHDGSMLTVDDVKYSIERNAGLLKSGEPALDSAFENITQVVATADNEIKIVLETPDTEFISYLDEPIIKKDSNGNSSLSVGIEDCIGTGPYILKAYTPGEKIVLEKYDGYWNEERAAHIKTVEFKVVSISTAIVEMKAGNIDIFPYITEDMAGELKAQYDILVGNTNLTQALYINNEAEVFSNVKIRQALNYAINKREILDMLAGGKGTILGSALFEGFGKYYKDLSSYYSYDKETAKALIKEVLGDEKLAFTVRVPSNYEAHMNTALVIQDQLKEIGVEMTIDAIDWNTWLTEVYAQSNYEATIVGIDAKLAPKDMMRRYYSEGSGNLANYSNAEYDTMYLEAISTVDEDKKVELYHKLQENLAQNAASVFIQDNALLVAVNKNLGGYLFYPIYVQDMASVYFK